MVPSPSLARAGTTRSSTIRAMRIAVINRVFFILPPSFCLLLFLNAPNPLRYLLAGEPSAVHNGGYAVFEPQGIRALIVPGAGYLVQGELGHLSRLPALRIGVGGLAVQLRNRAYKGFPGGPGLLLGVKRCLEIHTIQPLGAAHRGQQYLPEVRTVYAPTLLKIWNGGIYT